jgi:hypothetical protein
MKFSDLDLDIPAKESDAIRAGLTRATVLNERGDYQPHPAGVYFYKSIPSFEGLSVLDYKEMENNHFQKIDILNNSYLDDISSGELEEYLRLIEDEDIDWSELWEYDEPYQLGKYPGILREFKVSSVLDVAIILALIRPGAVSNYDKMKAYIHTDKLLNNKSPEAQDILKETYGIPIFDEQFKKLGKDDGKYRYKKPHSIGYAYVLLIDFLKNS